MHPLIEVGLRCPEHSDSRKVAEGCIASGESAGLYMLWDALLEENTEMFPIEIGKAYIFRTLTYYYTGRVVDHSLTSIVLEDAACIYDTGKWSTALKEGTLNEVEPFPDGVIISAAMVVDVAPWNHKLPRAAK